MHPRLQPVAEVQLLVHAALAARALRLDEGRCCYTDGYLDGNLDGHLDSYLDGYMDGYLDCYTGNYIGGHICAWARLG